MQKCSYISVSEICHCCFFQDHGTGALVISSLLDFLTFALCAPYSETTEGQQFDMLLEMVASNGRTLFKLFQVGTGQIKGLETGLSLPLE